MHTFLWLVVGCKNEPIIYPDGGYAFINTDTIKDKSFPYFPIRDIIASRDSMYAVEEEIYILRNFKIENISLKPKEKEIFRLSIIGRFSPFYFISLTDNKIIANKCEFERIGNIYSKLSDLEQFQLQYMGMNFLLLTGRSEDIEYPKRKKFADSLLKLYPQMSSPIYYKHLLEKANPDNLKFSSSLRIISLPNHLFKKIINKINNSGYWKLPLNLDCNDRPNDGIGFSLEANNGKKYNFVSSGDCMDPPSDFKKACQEIINYAHYDNEISLVHEEN